MKLLIFAKPQCAAIGVCEGIINFNLHVTEHVVTLFMNVGIKVNLCHNPPWSLPAKKESGFTGLTNHFKCYASASHQVQYDFSYDMYVI